MAFRRLVAIPETGGHGTYDRTDDGRMICSLEIDDATGIIYAGGVALPGPAGGGGGGGGGPATIPATKTLYVDGSRTDSYTATGSMSTPFKTIMAAVNQIVTNGDNSSVPYTIDISSGTYIETLDFSNSKLTNISCFGKGNTVVGNGDAVGGMAADAVRAVNNDNLTDLSFYNMSFYTTPQYGMTFSSTTNGTNFFSGANSGWGLLFFNCRVLPGTVTISNAGGFGYVDCVVNIIATITNSIIHYFQGCDFNAGGSLTLVSNSGLPGPANFSGQTQVQFRYSNGYVDCTCDAGSAIAVYQGSQMRGTFNLNGACSNREGFMRGNTINLNSGGTYTEEGGIHDGTLNLNGGNYVNSGVMGIKQILLNGSLLQTGSGSPNGAVTGKPGDMYLNTAGGSSTTFWIKESGSGTNTGWAGK
jgi:hypothetical protein